MVYNNVLLSHWRTDTTCGKKVHFLSPVFAFALELHYLSKGHTLSSISSPVLFIIIITGNVILKYLVCACVICMQTTMHLPQFRLFLFFFKK